MDTEAPSFFDPEAVASFFVERGEVVAEAAETHRLRHGVAPSATDVVRIAALGIDPQVAFCIPGASLFVPGAVEDTRRAIEWLYRNLSWITSLFFTLDTHAVHHIFHAAFWVDSEGRHPPPFTTITARDVREARYRPAGADATFPDLASACIEYCTALEAGGRHALTIWPYHALLGGGSHALVPALMEAVLFHALVRRSEPVFEVKGRALLTENYSAFSPEVRSLQGRPLGSFNEALFEKLMSHERIYVFGQAKSHCVLETLRDLRRECERRDPRLLGRIYILEDATSPVPPPSLTPLPESLDFPRLAARAFAELGEAGMHLVRTTDALGH